MSPTVTVKGCGKEAAVEFPQTKSGEQAINLVEGAIRGQIRQIKSRQVGLTPLQKDEQEIVDLLTATANAIKSVTNKD